MEFEIVRDPVWNNIRLDPAAMRLVDTRTFQRLRYVRQLGLAHLVYPGATHSRFQHALGTYHLAGRTLSLLAERGELNGVAHEERHIARVAALLHDVGHYPFSHALEEIGALQHEDVAGELLDSGDLGAELRTSFGSDSPARIHALVGGRSSSALQGLISGSLDLDKIEYLKRDALMCGVPYGEIDVDRLTNSMLLVRHPVSGALSVGVAEKALSALESLLFAKYQMYRNVYWHHAVRSATSMYKRMVFDAIRTGVISWQRLAALTDEGLLHVLEAHNPPLLSALRERRLYKRALEIPSNELSAAAAEWIASDFEKVVVVEDRLAAEHNMSAGTLLLDYPSKTQMLGVDIAVVRRDGTVQQLTVAGWPGTINLPALSEQLYRSTRWLRVFTAERTTLNRERIVAAVNAS